MILINLSDENFKVEDGERIAQIVIAPYVKAKWSEVKELATTDRGENGFGSTGKN